MSFARSLQLICRHPAWAAAEGSARFRRRFAPKHGVRAGSIGPVRFEFDFDMSPYMRQMYVGGYETDIVSLMRKLLVPGGVFVDIGANVGYLSAVGAGCVGLKGAILSCEPAPQYFKRLEALRDNNTGYNWDVYNIGLGAETADANLTMSAHNIGWNSLVPNQIPEDSVATQTCIQLEPLDKVLAQAKLPHVDLLKIDVEGYEGNVLRGAVVSLQAGIIKNIIVELLPGQYPAIGLDFNEIMAMVESCGYAARSPRWPYKHIRWSDITDGENVWFARVGPD